MEFNENDSSGFVMLATAIGEPSRAKMLFRLLDGCAYTARELAIEADVSTTSASNHLRKLLNANIVKVEKQGRYHYFSFFDDEIAFAVENFCSVSFQTSSIREAPVSGVKFCRTCYDHLAGMVGVGVGSFLLEEKILIDEGIGKRLIITEAGETWLENFGIPKQKIINSRRQMACRCLDWSERKHHVSGLVGALILEQMLARKWLKRIQFSRELFVTDEGRKQLIKEFNLSFLK